MVLGYLDVRVSGLGLGLGLRLELRSGHSSPLTGLVTIGVVTLILRLTQNHNSVHGTLISRHPNPDFIISE